MKTLRAQSVKITQRCSFLSRVCGLRAAGVLAAFESCDYITPNKVSEHISHGSAVTVHIKHTGPQQHPEAIFQTTPSVCSPAAGPAASAAAAGAAGWVAA